MVTKKLQANITIYNNKNDNINKKITKGISFRSIKDGVSKFIATNDYNIDNLTKCANDIKNYYEEDNDKDMLSVAVSEQGGDAIVSITLDELKKLVDISDSNELKSRLKQIYDDTVELNRYFSKMDETIRTPFDYLKDINGQNISFMFNGVCDEILKQNSLEEIQKIS